MLLVQNIRKYKVIYTSSIKSPVENAKTHAFLEWSFWQIINSNLT